MACDSNCGESMGLGPLGSQDTSVNRKFRWIFSVRGATNDPRTGVLALPHRKFARPILGWKEYEFQHLNETIFYPMKPAWEPIELTLYDMRKCTGKEKILECNPILTWIKNAMTPVGASGMYNPETGMWRPIVLAQMKRTADLYILDGSGSSTEHWILENCYPQHVRFGELDMDSSDPLTVDVTLRYDRAYCTID